MEVDIPHNPSTSREADVEHSFSELLDQDNENIPALKSCRKELTNLDKNTMSPNKGRKRLSDFGEDSPNRSMDLSDNIRQKPDIITSARTPGIYKYRRRVSTEPKIDYFSVFNIPTHILHLIFAYLNKKDLVNAMCACSRFYLAGMTATNWYRIDLYQRSIPQNLLITLLRRKTKVARLAETMITSPIKGSPIFHDARNGPLMLHLTHLDLGRASFPNKTLLVNILKACTKLRALCLESQELDEEGEVCRAIGNNPYMEHLDLSMVSGIETEGIEAIVRGCLNLRSLNMSWCGLDRNCTSLLCRRIPPSVTHINLAGTQDRNGISDIDVENLCRNCPHIIECDLSDNISLGDLALEAILSLEEIEVLTLSRCYGIDPINFMACGHIQYLNIYGTMTEDGEKVLRMTLPRTQINTSVFNHIAKPTVPPSVSSIWNQRTRDL